MDVDVIFFYHFNHCRQFQIHLDHVAVCSCCVTVQKDVTTVP